MTHTTTTTRDPHLTGFKMGWADAHLYATGNRRDRRAIRRRYGKSGACEAPFWRGYRDAFVPRLEAFADAIRERRLPRTVAPSRLYYLANH